MAASCVSIMVSDLFIHTHKGSQYAINAVDVILCVY